MLDRRSFLKAGLGSILFPNIALALGDSTKLDIAELTFDSGVVSRSGAWKRLLLELVQTTSVEALPRSVSLKVTDPELFEHPIAVLTGDGAIPSLSEEEASLLSRYLQYGGFLFIDDVSAGSSTSFDSSVRKLCSRIFPTKPLSPLTSNHSVYRSFFLLDGPSGRINRSSYLEGVTTGEISPIIYSRNDLSGAFNQDSSGRYTSNISFTERRASIKLGINLILYALTSNYKKDISHVRELMREGRIE